VDPNRIGGRVTPGRCSFVVLITDLLSAVAKFLTGHKKVCQERIPLLSPSLCFAIGCLRTLQILMGLYHFAGSCSTELPVDVYMKN
jgi:hypothetical protein